MPPNQILPRLNELRARLAAKGGLEYDLIDMVDDWMRNGYAGYPKFLQGSLHHLILVAFFEFADALTLPTMKEPD